MEVIVGNYLYITKIQVLELKEKLKSKYEYVRADFDYLLIKKNKATIKLTQDGLLYARKKVKNISEINKLEKWLNSIIEKLPILDKEDPSYTEILKPQKNKKIIIILNPNEDVDKIYKKLGRTHDYTFKIKELNKNFGDGLIVYEDIKLSKDKLNELIEYQTTLAAYQHLIRNFLKYNKELWKEITKIRKREKLKFKELTHLIDFLLDKKRKISMILEKIEQFDDHLLMRKKRCKIVPLLEKLKLNDFDELVSLNKNVHDQFDMTKKYISSTINLIEFIYKENEQKELNILQVIFAISAIGTVVSLGAMPGAKLFLKMSGDQIVGEMIAFNTTNLVIWTLLAVVTAIVLFMILNYVFLYAKKLKIINWVKRNKSK